MCTGQTNCTITRTKLLHRAAGTQWLEHMNIFEAHHKTLSLVSVEMKGINVGSAA